MAKRLVAERDVAEAAKRGEAIRLERGDVVTPLARDRAKELGVRLVVGERREAGGAKRAPKTIALASDWERRGLRLKLASALERRGWGTTDLGALNDSDDERVAAAARAAKELATEKAAFAILVDDVGFAATIVNRFSGARAFVCADELSARISRSIYDADALAIPATVVPEEKALAILDAWIDASKDASKEMGEKG
jgi:ribose 5-phosphate isomerase B